MFDLQNLLSYQFIIADETFSQIKLRQAISRDPKDFILLVDREKLPIRITTRDNYLARPRNATEDLKRASVTWAVPPLADISTPLPIFATLLPKIEQTASPGAVILREKQIIGILPKRSLLSIFSHVQQHGGLESTRYPDVYGVLAAANIPATVCYRCTRCNYQIKTSMQTDIPICTVPWHGKLVLTSCPSL